MLGEFAFHCKTNTSVTLKHSRLEGINLEASSDIIKKKNPNHQCLHEVVPTKIGTLTEWGNCQF